ncbi:MAG: hypothetical protein AB1782_02660 [Cyanobacteriota bacterium]
MPISQVRFTGISPGNKIHQIRKAVSNNASPVAFTGVNYGKLSSDVIKKINFPGILQGIKDVFRGIINLFRRSQPHLQKLNDVLERKAGDIWNRIRPVAH